MFSEFRILTKFLWKYCFLCQRLSQILLLKNKFSWTAVMTFTLVLPDARSQNITKFDPLPPKKSCKSLNKMTRGCGVILNLHMNIPLIDILVKNVNIETWKSLFNFWNLHIQMSAISLSFIMNHYRIVWLCVYAITILNIVIAAKHKKTNVLN